MSKRKFGNRGNWRRLLDKDYVQTYLESDEFTGYISLLKMNKVTEPLYVEYGDDSFCIVNDGYIWLQHFPKNEHYTVTTMFNKNGDAVQWYIDICSKQGLDSKGIPWMEDLYLDIIVLPSGRVILKDEDELDAAFANKTIDQAAYDLAKREFEKLLKLIKSKDFLIFNISSIHKDMLLKKLKEA